MTPAASFTLPCKVSIILQPGHLVVRFHPCGICFCQDILRSTASDGSNPHFVRILWTVHLLDKQIIAFRYKIHSHDIILTRITGQINPCSLSTGSCYVSHLNRRVRSSGLRIRETKDFRIKRIDIVDNVKPSGAFRIALPVGYVLAVGTPAETVTAGKFFFIHPVECTVHNRIASVAGQLYNLPVGNMLHIDIVSADISHTCTIGRELGKHQTALWQLCP